MNNNTSTTTILPRLLHRTGGYYIAAVVGIAQVIAAPTGVLLAALILYFNAEFTSDQIISAGLFAFSLVLARNIILLMITHLTNRESVTRLTKWKKGEILSHSTTEESRAWRQITFLSWRYFALSFSTLLIFALIPTSFYVGIVLGGNRDQVIYTLLSGIVAGAILDLLEVLLIERMLIPARDILLPIQFDTQIRGVIGFKILNKFIMVMVAIIIVGALLIAPIGYHQTVKVLYEEIGSIKVLADLQLQSIVVVIFTLLVGIGISFLLARSISRPVVELIDVFQKIETGDLSQRSKVTATDELGALAVHFNHMADRLEELQTNLEKRVTERTEQLRTTIDVGRVASSILDPNELISRVVTMITERFGYYYAAIFLVDPTNHWAELKEATGHAGQVLKAQNHRLEVSGRSMVGSAITKREARIALDVGTEPVRFDNPLLPQTRSEIALPLIVGNRVIGALDVQSMQEAAFDQENINTLQGMVNQVAIALENARLFQETQRNLDELRTVHRQYVKEAWLGLAHEKSHYEYSIEEKSKKPTANVVEVPISLREQKIGSLSLESSQDLSSEERNLIESIATQAAFALENARLIEESQQLALRERLVAEIAGKIWTSPSIDLILQTAVKELGRALRADEATIEIK